MLNSIRKQAGSWVVKALLGLLVVSFAIWGIGDIFYGGVQNPAVATVGDSDILASELSTEFDQTLNTMQRRLGTTLDRERAIQLGLMQRALQDLIARRLIALRAQDMGVTVTDATLREMIVDNPAFQTAGQFDRARFEQLLRANGMTDESYLAALRQEVTRRMLTESLAAPVAVPRSLTEALYRHRNEERRGRMLTVTADSITEVPEPTEEQLRTYHEEHENEFRAPELRRLTFVTLEPEDLLAEVEVPAEDIEAAYAAREAQYRTPERRSVEQLLGSEREAVEQAAARVAEGASLEAAAEAVDGVAFADLGEVSPGQMPAALEETILALGEGETSAPVESPFGWHLFRVEALEPEEVTPLAEVRDGLRRELALEEASARLPSLANALDDELAAGVRLEEAAQTLGLEAETIEAVSRQGQNPDGERPEALPAAAELLEIAFSSPEGETSLLEESEDGSYFVVRVDAITPARIKPLDEVRDEVVAAWQAEQRRELARERAAALRDEIAQGGSFDDVAADSGAELTVIEPVKRSAQGFDRGINPAVVNALFATEPGAVADEPVGVGNGFAVVVTDEVIAADPSADPDALARLEDELRAEMRADLLSQFQNALREAYPVSIHGAEINRLIDRDGLPPAGRTGGMPGGGGIF